MLTQEQLKELLNYDATTGVFIWKPRNNIRWNTQQAGKVAGSIQKKGYVHIKIFQKPYKAHQLAFLYMTGEFPTKDIDHLNGNKVDNSWGNLREVANKLNMRNQKKRVINQSGYTGVTKVRNKYRASIMVDGVNKHLGYYPYPDEAYKARQMYINSNPQLGFTTRHGH